MGFSFLRLGFRNGIYFSCRMVLRVGGRNLETGEGVEVGLGGWSFVVSLCVEFGWWLLEIGGCELIKRLVFYFSRAEAGCFRVWIGFWRRGVGRERGRAFWGCRE